MNPVRLLLIVLPLVIGLLTAQLAAADNHSEARVSLQQILVGDHRSAANIARNPSSSRNTGVFWPDSGHDAD